MRKSTFDLSLLGNYFCITYIYHPEQLPCEEYPSGAAADLEICNVTAEMGENLDVDDPIHEAFLDVCELAVKNYLEEIKNN